MSKKLNSRQVSALTKKVITIKSEEISVRDVIDKITFDDLSDFLTNLRQSWLEYEVLYGCTVRITCSRFYSWSIRAERLETDKEHNKRLEKNKRATELREARKERDKEKIKRELIKKINQLEREYLKMKAKLGDTI
jgi:hypothetical protein